MISISAATRPPSTPRNLRSRGGYAPPPSTPCDLRSRPEAWEKGDRFESSPAIEPLGSRPYFEASADQAAQRAYYRDLKLSPEPRQAFRQLSQLVKTSHRNQLDYDPDEYLYPWVDLRPNGQLESIYSPQSTWEQKSQMLSLLPLAPEAIAVQWASLEGQEALNCEHVVPQSWFDSKAPMRGDLHHLFACESRCNSYRANLEYKERAKDRSRQEDVPQCGLRLGQEEGFLPLAGKGAVARATLYFMLRYPDKIEAYSSKEVAMLKRWSQQEPPSLYEKHRNAAIQELQGNRNPFIDHPEWLSKLEFPTP